METLLNSKFCFTFESAPSVFNYKDKRFVSRINPIFIALGGLFVNKLIKTSLTRIPTPARWSLVAASSTLAYAATFKQETTDAKETFNPPKTLYS